MPTTLQDLRKAKYPTIKAFALAYGVSTSKASYLLRGKYQYTITKEEVQNLANIFEVSFDEAVDAVNNTYFESRQWPHDRYWKLKDRWERQEKAQKKYEEWKRQRETGRSWTIIFPWENASIFNTLGLTSSATETEIKQAFRDRVREMADGQGGYNGDMDKLVQAKEKALAHVRRT